MMRDTDCVQSSAWLARKKVEPALLATHSRALQWIVTRAAVDGKPLPLRSLSLSLSRSPVVARLKPIPASLEVGSVCIRMHRNKPTHAWLDPATAALPHIMRALFSPSLRSAEEY